MERLPRAVFPSFACRFFGRPVHSLLRAWSFPAGGELSKKGDGVDDFRQSVQDFFNEFAAMPLSLRLPLSLMMFLEFAIWGGWFVVLGNYLNSLNFSRKQIARVYATIPIGAIISPMFIGTIADRYFNAEDVMGVLHLAGGCLLVWLARIRTPKAFFWVALAYAVLYGPTLSLVNSILFVSADAYKEQFPTIRVWGTIGWIVAGMSLMFFIRSGEPVNNRPILLSAALSFVLGIFSFFLPETEPGAVLAQRTYDTTVAKLAQERDSATISQEEFDERHAAAETKLEDSTGVPLVRAVRMFRDRDSAVFFIASLVIAMAMAVYFAFAAIFLEEGAKVKPENIGPVMTLGQWVEIFFLFTLSLFIKAWGYNTVLIIGMVAWALRFAIFAARPPFAIIAIGVALHGICFDFFFATGMMYTNEIAPEDIKNSAQSLYGVLVYGLGMWLGSEAAGWLNHSLTQETHDPTTGATVRVTDWTKFWLVACIGVVIPLIVFILFLGKPKAEESAPENGDKAAVTSLELPPTPRNI
jgi:predicted MFS family arabinose efflux permease